MVTEKFDIFGNFEIIVSKLSQTVIWFLQKWNFMYNITSFYSTKCTFQLHQLSLLWWLNIVWRNLPLAQIMSTLFNSCLTLSATKSLILFHVILDVCSLMICPKVSDLYIQSFAVLILIIFTQDLLWQQIENQKDITDHSNYLSFVLKAEGWPILDTAAVLFHLTKDMTVLVKHAVILI